MLTIWLLVGCFCFILTKTSHKIGIGVNNTTTLLYLKGIINYGGNHFTSIIISKDGKIWFNDGNTTGGKIIKKHHLFTMTEKALENIKAKILY